MRFCLYPLLFLLLIIALAGCEAAPVPTPAPAAASQAAPSTQSADLPAPPDPAIPTPGDTPAEELLTGPGQGPPDVYVAPVETTMRVLAAFLRTSVAQLERLNPDLPDPVAGNTLVTVPLDYITAEGETLADVAEATGLDEQIVRRANPKLGEQDILDAETRLLMPRLYIVYEATSLETIAEDIGVAPGTLLSFNPEWSGIDPLPADAVLVVPFN